MEKPDYEKKIAELLERQPQRVEDLVRKIAYVELYATLHWAQAMRKSLDGEQS